MSRAMERARAALGPGASVAWAPFRVSPFGAHTDHQLGLTAGFTLDHGLALAFRATGTGRVILESEAFPGTADLATAGPAEPTGAWTDYVAGVLAGTAAAHGPLRGLEGVVCADLPGGGIASSAALQVAVILALAEVNGLRLSRPEIVGLVVSAEQRTAGVPVGRLDPTVILEGRDQALVVLDPLERRVGVHRFPGSFPPFEVVLVHGGGARDLRRSPYAERVAECRDAARRLGSPSEPPRLRDVTPEAFRRRRAELPELPRRRAEHWFAEVKRVKRALQVLAAGDLPGFGSLMSASTDGLITFFDCGTPETVDLVKRLRRDPDVLGAGFCGGGFGGLVQAIVPAGRGGAVVERFGASPRGATGPSGTTVRAHCVRLGGGARVVSG